MFIRPIYYIVDVVVVIFPPATLDIPVQRGITIHYIALDPGGSADIAYQYKMNAYLVAKWVVLRHTL